MWILHSEFCSFKVSHHFPRIPFVYLTHSSHLAFSIPHILSTISVEAGCTHPWSTYSFSSGSVDDSARIFSTQQTMTPRSFDDKDTPKGSRQTLPLSNSTTETASMQDVSVTSSIESHHDNEPNWPRSWRAYACWLGCFFLMFNSWGLVNAYGTFASFYVGNSLRNNDQLELNLIGSTQSFLVLLFSAPVGRLLDAGHFRAVVATGAFLVPFGMFMLSVAHPKGDNALASYVNIWVTQGFVVGLGMACYFVSSSQSKLFARYLDTRLTTLSRRDMVSEP
jgi:hypothetical protein